MERFGLPSHRGFSVRSILTFALLVVVATLLLVLVGSHTTHALGDTDASWSGDTIIYDGHGFTQVTDFKDTSNTIPAGATVYQAPIQPGQGNNAQKALIIYFSSGIDPPTATSAKYAEFSYSSTKTLSSPQNTKDIKLTIRGKETQLNSCSVAGIGWIICPVSVFIAGGMDWIFNILAQMISVQPAVIGDPGNSMYVAWNVMRNIANVAFVIVFLVIIYSQLSNFGVSNYGLKKLVPRLIVAAVLVNLSFIVTAAAIDVSNILGYSVQNLFNDIGKNVFSLTNDNFAGVNNNPWTAVTGVVLAGGGYVGATYFLSSGGIVLLLPVLLGLILTIILVVVILAARQAIIVILVIVAPLAFVANLLPNTEKWFDKWKDLFFTMLIFFPAFSLVFGGSQLAGQIIIQNASDNIIMVIFGLAVQVAPLVITPLILKLSGGLLGKIAQVANNPSKGILDRNKAWANNKAEQQKQKTLSKKKLSPLNVGGKLMQRADTDARKTKSRTELYKMRADNKYHGSKAYEKLHEDTHEAELEKQRIENTSTAHLQGKMSTKGTKLNIKTVELENAKVLSERATAQTAEMISGYRAGSYNTAGNAHLAKLQKTMAENVIETAAWKQGEQNNQYVMQRNISGKMRNDTRLLDIAQGYGDPNDASQILIGRDRAQASAVATLAKLNKDARDNAITLMQTEAIEAHKSVKDYAVQNVITDASSNELTIRQKITKTRLEAALEIAADDGQVAVFDDARSNIHIDQDLVDAVVARNVANFKSKGGFHTQANPNLSLQRYIESFNKGERPETSLQEVEASFFRDLKVARLETLSNTTSDNLGGMKYGAFERLAKDISDPTVNLLDVIQPGSDGQYSARDMETIQKISESLRGALSDPTTRASMTDRLAYARDMEEAVRFKFFKDVKPPLPLSDEEKAVPGGGQRGPTVAQNGPVSNPNVDVTEDSPSEDQDS